MLTTERVTAKLTLRRAAPPLLPQNNSGPVLISSTFASPSAS
jgi:hypothetical protein